MQPDEWFNPSSCAQLCQGRSRGRDFEYFALGGKYTSDGQVRNAAAAAAAMAERMRGCLRAGVRAGAGPALSLRDLDEHRAWVWFGLVLFVC